MNPRNPINRCQMCRAGVMERMSNGQLCCDLCGYLPPPEIVELLAEMKKTGEPFNPPRWADEPESWKRLK